MNGVSLKQFPSAVVLAQAAARAWLEDIRRAQSAAATYAVALAGGRIAGPFYAAVVTGAQMRPVDFSRVQFFWSDERCVPPEDAESNYRLAREELLSPLAVPASNVHRILGEEPPEFAAQEAEAEVCRLVELDGDGQPQLDLVMLGLGEDGHVASLFPPAGTTVRPARNTYQAVTDSPKPPANRVTLGYAALAAARKVWVLAAGAGKRPALQNSLAANGITPLARVIRSRSETVIFTDALA
jgi:6-phosphogluconolactonase